MIIKLQRLLLTCDYNTTESVAQACLLITETFNSYHIFRVFKHCHNLSLLSVWVPASDSKVWIGLYMETGSPTVEWSDGSPLTLTSWQRQQPSPRHEDRRMCVAADRKVRPADKGQTSARTPLRFFINECTESRQDLMRS